MKGYWRRASRIPLQQLIASSDEIMQSKEKEDQEIQNDPYLIEFVKCAKLNMFSWISDVKRPQLHASHWLILGIFSFHIHSSSVRGSQDLKVSMMIHLSLMSF